MIRTTPTTRDARAVILSPQDCALLGLDPAETMITLPDGFDQLTPAERARWAWREIAAMLATPLE